MAAAIPWTLVRVYRQPFLFALIAASVTCLSNARPQPDLELSPFDLDPDLIAVNAATQRRGQRMLLWWLVEDPVIEGSGDEHTTAVAMATEITAILDQSSPPETTLEGENRDLQTSTEWTETTPYLTNREDTLRPVSVRVTEATQLITTMTLETVASTQQQQLRQYSPETSTGSVMTTPLVDTTTTRPSLDGEQTDSRSSQSVDLQTGNEGAAEESTAGSWPVALSVCIGGVVLIVLAMIIVRCVQLVRRRHKHDVRENGSPSQPGVPGVHGDWPRSLTLDTGGCR